MSTPLWAIKGMNKIFGFSSKAIKTFKADKVGGKAWTKIKTTGKKVPSWVKSNLKAIKSPIGKFNTKAYKHVTKHPVKYAAGASAVGGFGLAKTHSSQEKKLKTYFGKLPKSDPRYKALKKKGYV